MTAGNIYELSEINQYADQIEKHPWNIGNVSVRTETLGVILYASFIAHILIRTYLIWIVWRCFKYLLIVQYDHPIYTISEVAANLVCIYFQR